MKKHKPSGFTLIELVVVIVILGVLAVTAAPRFLSYQRDAHVSRADAAFASFANAIQLYQAKWLTEGEPTSHVDYGIEDIYPSALGFPMSVNHEPSDPALGPIRGEDCVAMWNALMQVDLTIRPLTSTILPSDTDIVAWYTANNECTYYYTSGYDERGAGIYNLRVDSESQTTFVATPALELGARLALQEGWVARGFVRGGVSFSSEDNWTTSAALIEAPVGSGTFEGSLALADVVGRVATGAQVHTDAIGDRVVGVGSKVLVPVPTGAVPRGRIDLDHDGPPVELFSVVQLFDRGRAHRFEAGDVVGRDALDVAVALDRLGHHVTAAPAIAAIGAAEFDVLFPPERNRAVPAGAGTNVDLCEIEEFHLSLLPQRSLSLAAPAAQFSFRTYVQVATFALRATEKLSASPT